MHIGNWLLLKHLVHWIVRETYIFFINIHTTHLVAYFGFTITTDEKVKETLNYLLTVETLKWNFWILNYLRYFAARTKYCGWLRFFWMILLMLLLWLIVILIILLFRNLLKNYSMYQILISFCCPNQMEEFHFHNYLVKLVFNKWSIWVLIKYCYYYYWYYLNFDFADVH